jgi:hypothetical protein
MYPSRPIKGQRRCHIKNTSLGIIIDFHNKTNIIQFIIIFCLLTLFGINLGFNDGIISWLMKLLSGFLSKNDIKTFSLKYVVILSFSILVLVKAIFTLLAVLFAARGLI